MKPVNRVADHFRAPEPPGSGPTVRTVGPAVIQGGVSCSCGCGQAAVSLRLGDVMMLVGSAEAAAKLADAIRDAAAETWKEGGR
jgi:hypothetical protein